MSARKLSWGFPALLVMVGTFAAPLAQWIVFFIVARVGGSTDAGTFALLLAVATPLVTGANWGLRNGYITLRRRLSFADFVVLRVVGVLVASAILIVFGVWTRLDAGMVAAVIVMKAADSMTDIWYGRWQRQQRLLPFAWMMVVNGVITVGCAALFALLKLAGAWIVFGSALGSIVTFFGVLVIDVRDIAYRLCRGGYVQSGSMQRIWRIVVDCWQISAGQVFAGLVVNVPTWAVGLFGTTNDVGRFAAAGYMITVGSLLGSSLNSVVLGRYHAEMMSGGTAFVKRSVRRGNAVATGAGLAAVILIGLVGVKVFELIYGSQFVFTPLELILIALAAALNPGTFLMNAALLAVNSYTAQLTIVAVALVGSVAVVGVAAGLQLSGFLVGASCALAGSLLKYALSWVWFRRVANTAPAPSRDIFPEASRKGSRMSNAPATRIPTNYQITAFDPAATIVLYSGFTSAEDFFIEATRRRGVAADVSLRPVPWKPLRALRRLHLLSPLPGKSVWFGRWLRMGKFKRLIVVHAADLTLPAARHAARRFPDARVVFWFWNPAAKRTDPLRAQGNGLELWSFDIDDCARYGMRHNTQFEFAEIAQIGERVSPDVDLGFFGADKGRAAQLSALAECAETLGLSHRFQVVPSTDGELERYPLLVSTAPISYPALLNKTARARVIVDIAQEGQSGMTLRTLESLYLRRKLMTNIRSVRDSPLYDPTRVFVLGEDDLDDLPAFLRAAPSTPSARLWSYYDFDNWLRRFWRGWSPRAEV